MDYSTLLATLASRLNRTDLASELPSFIASAEEVMNARLARTPIRPMETTLPLVATGLTTLLPSNIVELVDVRALTATDSWQLTRLPADAPDGFYRDALPYGMEREDDRPQHYTAFGEALTLSSAPTGSLTLSIRYFAKLPALTSGAPVNWMSDRHGIVYELGCLAMAYRHLRDDEAAARKTDEFLAALELVIESYPERYNVTELRAVDAPWAGGRGNFLYG